MTLQKVNNSIKGITCSHTLVDFKRTTHPRTKVGSATWVATSEFIPRRWRSAFWPVKLFDLSSSKRRCVSSTKQSRCDHTILRTEPRVRHDIPLHSYRLYAPSCWCTTIATIIKLYSFRSRSVCRSRDDRSRTHARTRWSPDRFDRTHRTESQRILRLKRERTPRSPTTHQCDQLSSYAPPLRRRNEPSSRVAKSRNGNGTPVAPILYCCSDFFLADREEKNKKIYSFLISVIILSLSLFFYHCIYLCFMKN